MGLTVGRNNILLNFKPIEFDMFKTRVEERFPHPEIFNRVTVSHPVIDDDKRIITLMTSDICQ